MRKPRKILSVKEFTFTITEYDDEKAEVLMRTLDVDHDDIATATKYMMWMVSTLTRLTFDETMEFLARGAANFTGTKKLRLLPRKGGDDS